MVSTKITVAVTVRDYGVGLAARRGEAGVQPVLAVGPVTRTPVRWHRLGLAISVEDARLHQGRLGGMGRSPVRGACFRPHAAHDTWPQGHHQPVAHENRSRSRHLRTHAGETTGRRDVSAHASTPSGAGDAAVADIARLAPSPRRGWGCPHRGPFRHASSSGGNSFALFAVCARRLRGGCPVRRRRKPSARSSDPHRRICPSRPRAMDPDVVAARTSSRPQPIRPTGTWRRGQFRHPVGV